MAERRPLHDILDDVAALDPSSLSDDEITQTLVAAQALLNAVFAATASVVEEFDRRALFAEDGALSAAGWVAARTGTAKGAIGAQLAAGKVLRRLPSAAMPARQGRLSTAHLSVLARAERQHPALAARDEELLVGQALDLDADGFRAAARHWCDLAENIDAAGPEPSTEPADELHLSQTFDGRWELRGSFGPDTGAIIDAALGAEVDRRLRAERDDPSAGLVGSQVRASALVDLLGQGMRREHGDGSVPDRYRVGIVVPLDRLDVLGVAACDSVLYRIVVGADGEVLDIGRSSRTWPPGIRRAITHRDGGCIFPGCDRPASWCDVHHCEPWEQGGRTSVDNGVLLCRSHHTFIHKERWSIRVEHGRPVTRRPDGTEHAIARWPNDSTCRTPRP